MNERIRELAEQAEWRFADRATGEFSEYDNRLKKFAELIVNECLEVIDSRNRKQFHPTSICGELLYNVAKDVKQHFGVEE